MTPPNPHQQSRLNVALRPAVRHQLDALAAERGVTVTGLVNALLEQTLLDEMHGDSDNHNI